MKRDVKAAEFEEYSKEKQKKYVAELVIRASNSTPVDITKTPLAIVMAGLPGAGKTEFLDTMSELLVAQGLGAFVRIDLDQIVTVFPHYTPQAYDKFRSQGNYALARCVDVAREQRYNMMVDGTFSGSTGASLNNVAKLLAAGYRVEMYYMYDDAPTAWGYTQSREIETKRGISKSGFLKSCENIPTNLKKAVTQFGRESNFSLKVVIQKKLRDKVYDIVSSKKSVDKIIEQGYNIDSLKKLL